MLKIQEIRDPHSEGEVKKLFCNMETADDGSARFVSKGKRVNTSIDVMDFLRQIPKQYIDRLATEPQIR